MFFYFKHACDDALHKHIDTAGGEKYFMVCIGDENYLFCVDEDTAWKIRGLLFLENVVFQVISSVAMGHILAEPDSLSQQKFHGNKKLYETFAANHGLRKF